MSSADDFDRKAEWHAKRAGKLPNAKIGKVAEYTYQAELRHRRVRDDDGNRVPLKYDKPEVRQPQIRPRTADSTSDEHEMSKAFAFR